MTTQHRRSGGENDKPVSVLSYTASIGGRLHQVNAIAVPGCESDKAGDVMCIDLLCPPEVRCSEISPVASSKTPGDEREAAEAADAASEFNGCSGESRFADDPMAAKTIDHVVPMGVSVAPESGLRSMVVRLFARIPSTAFGTPVVFCARWAHPLPTLRDGKPGIIVPSRVYRVRVSDGGSGTSRSLLADIYLPRSMGVGSISLLNPACAYRKDTWTRPRWWNVHVALPERNAPDPCCQREFVGSCGAFVRDETKARRVTFWNVPGAVVPVICGCYVRMPAGTADEQHRHTAMVVKEEDNHDGTTTEPMSREAVVFKDSGEDGVGVEVTFPFGKRRYVVDVLNRHMYNLVLWCDCTEF